MMRSQGNAGRTTIIERLARSVDRRFELIRGHIIHWRGAHIGTYFGVGKSTQILYPAHLMVGDYVTIGDFSFLDCFSGQGVKIGDHSSIDRNLWLSCGGAQGGGTGFFEIGHHSYIGCNAVIGAGGGGIRIGNNVLIGQSVNMHSESHVIADISKLIREQGILYRGIVVEDNVWIGSKAAILDGVVIGTGSVVGAGAVVTKPVQPYSIVAGVPARVIGTRDHTNENSNLP